MTYQTTQKIRFIGLTVFALLSAGCATTNVASLDDADKLMRDERRLWDESREASEVIKEKFTTTDVNGQNYCQSIVDKILAANANLPKEWRPQVTVLTSTEANAFAMPHGDLFITEGMLALIENDDQLAFIMSHEMSHYLERHSLTSRRHAMNEQTKSAIFGSLLLVTLGIPPQTGGRQSVWQIASNSGYSRALEMEADTLGLSMMMQAGYAGGEAGKALAKLRTGDETVPDMLYASHPSIDDRINKMTRILSEREHSVMQASATRFQETFDHLLLPQATALIESGEVRAASGILERYLMRHPDNAKALFFKGEMIRAGSSSRAASIEAAAYYEQAIAASDTPVAAYRELGMHFRLIGEHERARPHFQNYVDLAPDAIDVPVINMYLKVK